VNGYRLPFALGLLAGLAVGCTSAPVHYYTLAPPPDKNLPAAQTPIAIDVRIVHIPPQLNRSELMVRTGPTEVALLDNERWTSPLSDEIKDALRLELQSRLGRGNGTRLAFTRLTLAIDVRQLEAELGQYALLEASWSATLSATDQRSAGARTATCAFQADEKILAGYAGMVEGYQREIAALADAIAAVSMDRASGGDCQKSIDVAAGGSGSKDR
jgi:uncharacterized lipoprotein YmbA